MTILSNLASPIQVGGPEYETVAAGVTNQILGTTGAVGDTISHLLIVPANLNPGTVVITDGSETSITVFVGGSASVSTLHPFTIQWGGKSISGGWKISTGANVSVVAFGSFT